MTQVPLADGAGGIPTLLENVGDCYLGVVQSVPRTVVEGAGDADAVGIASGEQRRTGRGANRLRDVKVGESPALNAMRSRLGVSKPTAPKQPTSA